MSTENQALEPESGKEISKRRGQHSTTEPNWKSYVYLLVLLFLYVGVVLLGGFIFTVLEGNQEKEKGSNDTNGDVSDATFGFEMGFLLCFSISSTIGYGDLLPVTAGGKLFTILFGVISIPLMASLVLKFGSLKCHFAEKIAESTLRTTGFLPARIVVTSAAFVVGIVLYMILPSIMITYIGNEYEWSFVDSLYFVFITLSTVGFGDLILDTRGAGMWANVLLMAWFLLSASWMACLCILIHNTWCRQPMRSENKVSDLNGE